MMKQEGTSFLINVQAQLLPQHISFIKKKNKKKTKKEKETGYGKNDKMLQKLLL